MQKSMPQLPDVYTYEDYLPNSKCAKCDMGEMYITMTNKSVKLQCLNEQCNFFIFYRRIDNV